MTEWIMVAITFVYVIATIFICIFNYRSAKATKEQVELSKAQYADDTRLKLMPCLLVEQIDPTVSVNGTIEYEFDYGDSGIGDESKINGEFCFKVTNVGYGIAKEIEYFVYAPQSDYRRYRIISFSINDNRTVRFVFACKSGNKQKLELQIIYKDLLDNKYIQTLSIFLDASKDSIKMETFYITAPQYVPEKNNVDI